MINPKEDYDPEWRTDKGLGNTFSFGENPCTKLMPRIYFCKTNNKKVALLVFPPCMTVCLFCFSFSA